MILSIDTNSTAEPTLAAPFTDQQFIQWVVARAVRSWAAFFNAATGDAAIAAAREASAPDALSGVGMRQRIKGEGRRRKVEGGFLPASGANPKWLLIDHLPVINAATALGGLLPTGAKLVAMDGTNYGLNAVKAAACQLAAVTQLAATDDAVATAIAAWVANPSTFNFDAIAWPAIYIPA